MIIRRVHYAYMRQLWDDDTAARDKFLTTDAQDEVTLRQVCIR